MRQLPRCVLLLALAATEAVCEYRGADNRVADADSSSGARYPYQPRSPPTALTGADQPNYIERTPQHYSYPSRSGRRRVHGRPHGRRATTGLYRTSQRGSVYIPYRGAVVPVPVIAGRTKPYRGTITTTVIASDDQNVNQNSVGLPVRDAPAEESVCVRCPADKTVVARKGSNYVLMERSKLKRCRRRPKVPGAKFEILHGPQPGSVLTEGVHTVMGRVLYRHAELLRCQYSYEVIVRKCSPLMLSGSLETRCSEGDVWGSRCRLSCRRGYHLVGGDVVECGSDLQWTAPLPVCRVSSSCAVPMSPDNGRLSCQSGPGQGAGADNDDQLPDGSTCRYECDEGFAVPAAQGHLLVTACFAGQWNSSVDASCLPVGSSTFADDTSEIGAFQSDSIHHTVRLRHRKNRHLATKSPGVDPCTPNPCQAGGTCLAGPHQEPVLCLCPVHREGQFCERELCGEDVCKNGGKCLMQGAETTCYCRQGYSGSHCEVQVTLPPGLLTCVCPRNVSQATNTGSSLGFEERLR